MTTQALYLTWNPLKLPSHPLYMSSPLCWRNHTYCVWHHRWHMYAIIRVIHDIILTLYDNPFYLWHHLHSIHYITCIIYDISPTLYDVTFTMFVTSHNDSTYDIKHYKFMTYSLDMASCTVLWKNSHCVPSQPLCLTLHSVYVWHSLTNCIYDDTPILRMPSYAIYRTSYLLFMTSHHCNYHIISTEFMTSNTLYMTSHTWQYKRYICHLKHYI